MGSNMKKILMLGVIKKLVLVAVLLFPAVSEACMVGPDWEEKTLAAADKNKDGNIDFAEYKAALGWKPENEHIGVNSWKALAGDRQSVTAQEYLSSQRPKCRG